MEHTKTKPTYLHIFLVWFNVVLLTLPAMVAWEATHIAPSDNTLMNLLLASVFVALVFCCGSARCGRLHPFFEPLMLVTTAYIAAG
jgi:hypothetical protein